MDVEDIRKLEKVVDRLAAAGPSGVSAPHCWFCGKITAWFLCDCKDAMEAQQGKRNKPRWVEKDGKSFIILDPDVIAREHNQRRKRYDPNVTQDKNAPKRGGETNPPEGVTDESTSVSANSGEDAVSSVTPVIAESVTPSRNPAAERQRRKRERDRAAKDGTPPAR